MDKSLTATLKNFYSSTRANFLVLSIGVLCIQSCQLSNARMPHINVVKNDEIIREEKTPCLIEYKDGNQELTLSGNIKTRGGMSVGYKKKSYGLELDQKFKLASLPKDDDWILNASYIDKTFMRHKISYELFEEMHKDNVAARASYATLSYNGNPKGIYVITEEINGSKVKLDKNDPMAMLFKDPPFLYPEILENPQDKNDYYQQKFPKKFKDDKTAYIEEFRSFLFDSSDEEFDQSIGDWIDVHNVMDWYLLVLFTNNADGIMKNFYLYKKNSTTPFRVAIWDYDHSFGRDGNNKYNMLERGTRWERSILFTRLMESKTMQFQKRLAERWKQLRASNIISEENINFKIKENEKMLRPSLEMNSGLWPNKAYYYLDDNDFDQEIAIIQKYIPLRLAQMDKEYGYTGK